MSGGAGGVGSSGGPGNGLAIGTEELNVATAVTPPLAEIGPIEEVEELGPELDVARLVDVDILEEGKIHGDDPGILEGAQIFNTLLLRIFCSCSYRKSRTIPANWMPIGPQASPLKSAPYPHPIPGRPAK